MGCAHPARPAAAPDDRSESEDDDRPTDKSALSDTDRAWFDSQEVSVVDGNSGRSSYALRTSDGEITQEEFVERYQTTTGRKDIDKALYGHSGTALIVTGIVLTAAAVACEVAWAVVTAQQPAQSCTVVPGTNTGTCSSTDSSAVLAGTVGFPLLGAGGVGLIVGGVRANDEDHKLSGRRLSTSHLSRSEAKYFVGRYNRALLRGFAGSREPAPPHKPQNKD